MQNFKISLITVAYNAQNTIERCITSVLGQKFNNIQYIIIDGGSTDGTIQVINKYSTYLPVALELQSGSLSGGGLTTALHRYGRKYFNNYYAVLLHADFYLGEVIDYSNNWKKNVLKNLYFGAGIGMTHNANTTQRCNVYPRNSPLTNFGNYKAYVKPLRYETCRALVVRCCFWVDWAHLHQCNKCVAAI